MDPVTGPAPSRPAFVLHEHRHPRHHFDLRLEESGVLRSWALPRGLPVGPDENRLAIEVAAHQLDHLTYQDVDKSIADHGWWEEHDGTNAGSCSPCTARTARTATRSFAPTATGCCTTPRTSRRADEQRATRSPHAPHPPTESSLFAALLRPGGGRDACGWAGSG